ncbi:TetR/AcrR family transcriptional regulator [Consotaella salsifontis]|uniref:Transcriptional regulator, TetR family n=1 Tax=Consotaella salsifontis TaxID=1365950 RepID=A0A1T4QQD2_9HYPH|nr:TetR/AcrR family transcriptional regulator [Consotaella salsifontis]SKA05950.1 transcriptional regulator, TetR family [Consotaella salsifontis]
MDKSKKPRRRAGSISPDERVQAILEAACAVFLEKGFANARVEDVAARAGIAKGTVYLHFASKEALFEALISSLALPPLDGLTALLADETGSSADLLRRAIGIFKDGVLASERRHVLRLLLTEGPRFPAIARFHHDHVVSRAIPMLRAVVARGVERGEFATDALARFPHLFVSPMLLALVWEALFSDIETLDVDGLMNAHLELILRAMEPR